MNALLVLNGPVFIEEVSDEGAHQQTLMNAPRLSFQYAVEEKNLKPLWL
jgi:hypothetical protein